MKEDVGKDRVHIIQATIVRIMKSRRVMKHQELLVEVVGQTQKMFAADVKLVKKQIESLIEVGVAECVCMWPPAKACSVRHRCRCALDPSAFTEANS